MFPVTCTVLTEGASPSQDALTHEVLELMHEAVRAAVPKVQQQVAKVNTAQILRLHPNAHIRPHCGPDNRRLVIHLGLRVPACAKDSTPCIHITCGNVIKTWQEGKCLFFDDSFEHEVRYVDKTGEDRIVLALQVANPVHPDLAMEMNSHSLEQDQPDARYEL
jgi:aspartyl/asparaginyl beta-hydroxylase (cupin superfamily)